MNLSKKDGYLIIVAVIICIIISCLSPFIASGNPDGLEKSAEDAGLAEDYGVDGLNEIYSSPFPDYTFEPLGSLGEIGVLILGAVICLAGGFVVGKIIEEDNNRMSKIAIVTDSNSGIFETEGIRLCVRRTV